MERAPSLKNWENRRRDGRTNSIGLESRRRFSRMGRKPFSAIKKLGYVDGGGLFVCGFFVVV